MKNDNQTIIKILLDLANEMLRNGEMTRAELTKLKQKLNESEAN